MTGGRGLDDIKPVFWHDSIRVGEHPPLTDAMVERAEAALGVTLPATYLELLRVRNGGTVAFELDAFPTVQPTSWAPDHVPLPDLYGIPEQGTAGILDTAYLCTEWGLPAGLVLLTGDGHWWLALDYRTSGPNGEPSISWLDTELGEDVHVADDFESFVTGLVASAQFELD